MDFESATDLFWTTTVWLVAIAILVPLAAGAVVGVRALLRRARQEEPAPGREKYGR